MEKGGEFPHCGPTGHCAYKLGHPTIVLSNELFWRSLQLSLEQTSEGILQCGDIEHVNPIRLRTQIESTSEDKKEMQ